MKRNILLVDDYPPIRDSIDRALRLEGWEVVQAFDGEMALLALAEYPIDLVILDLEMPGRDGWQTLPQLAANFDSVPVVVITGKRGEQGLAAKSGVAAVLEKPFEMMDLMGLIDRILRPVSRPSFPASMDSCIVSPTLAISAKGSVPGTLLPAFAAGVYRWWSPVICSPRLAMLLLVLQRIFWR